MGLANRLGVLDFAGVTPVHISSGSAALAIAIYLRKRSRGDASDRTNGQSMQSNQRHSWNYASDLW